MTLHSLDAAREFVLGSEEVCPNVFGVVVDVDLPVLVVTGLMVQMVLEGNGSWSWSCRVGVDQAKDSLMGFPCTFAWKGLSIDVRCSTSFAIEVRMDELVKRDVDT